jgi:hypothetical protein
MENRIYFSKIQREYREYYAYSGELYQNAAEKLDKILFGKVIDFGNGGIINYNTDSLEKLICVDIINKSQMITDNKIDFIYGDFYDIELDGKVDCVLIQFLLHHLTDDERLHGSIQKLKHLINENGKIIILEVVFPRYLERLQNVLKPLFFMTLRALKRPDLRFFSRQALVGLLSTFQPSDIKVQYIPIGKKVVPAPVLFPKLKLPGRLYPLKCILIEASL